MVLGYFKNTLVGFLSAIHSNGQSAPPPVSYYLSTEITSQRFTDSLLDPNSTDYNNLTSMIDNVVRGYDGSSSSLGVAS